VFNKSHFTEIRSSKKIWAIGSIHAHLDSFDSIKKYILKSFSDGDKLIFLGNIIGFGENSNETLTSAINLRNLLLAKFCLKNDDVIFLRGAQEEMFLKLLQLQISPNPTDIVKWMFEHGVDKTAESYGIYKDKIIDIANQGTLSISRLTKTLNDSINEKPGHKEYFINLKHAAFSNSKKILFVNRGVDISRPLSAQNDCFWWGYQNFSQINHPYTTFIKIVRGYASSPSHDFNNYKNKIVCSLYKPPLENKNIVAGIFNESGEILDLFEST
tara:strand:+ start:619 stop:1431 length:813 start_codon:yes stop_codon:yes gene_type:complete